MMLRPGLGLGDAIASGSVGPVGPELPTGYAARPFNCPEGSDFDASQRMGMCVGPDYGAIVTGEFGGAQYVYDLQGVRSLVAGTGKPPAKDANWIPGIPNIAVIGALGLFLVMRMAK